MTGSITRRGPEWLLVVGLVLVLISLTVSGNAQISTAEVTGVVLDARGAVIIQAKILLRKREDASEQTQTTNDKGHFRFTRVKPGTYDLEVLKDGFDRVSQEVIVGGNTSAPLHIVLPIGELREHTAVVAQSNQVSTNPDENLNTIKLDRAEIRNLPVLDNDVIAGLTRLLDAGSVGSAGATIIVDGVETDRRRVAASTIQEVRINQNPYSAEFSRPGRGRIEVITKAGTAQYHGEFNFIFRDHHFDARNAFASSRPPEQRRIFEGNINGPLRGKKTTFLFGMEREEDDLQSVIFARTPAGTVSQNVPYPNRETDLSFRLTHQASDRTAVSFRYESEFESADNEGVGGFNLIDVATKSRNREHELYFSHRRIISPNLINEFTVRFDRDRAWVRGAALDSPRIVVLDAFTSGGSQVNRNVTEYGMRLNESISWTKGKHFLKAGINVPDLNRITSVDLSNFGGTFSFSSLDDYVNNRPFLYSINHGNGGLAFWQKEFGLFVQDNILLRQNLSVSLGVRYDWQNYLHDRNNIAPRFSFAWAPGRERKTVLRGGVGVFYDRTGDSPIADVLRFDGQRLRRFIISNPGFPDPFASGGTLAAQPVSVIRFAPDLRSPYSTQSSLGIERQLTKSMTVSANYINTVGSRLFRSRNINAPVPPSPTPPDAEVGVLRQIESTARANGHALELMFRGKIGNIFNGTAQYTFGRTLNNTGGIDSLPANSYDLKSEWSRADFDERHRFSLLGTVKAGEWFNLGLSLSLSSGRPYSLITGRDDNGDTIANDRPAGVRRNSLQGPGSARLDVRWSREFEIRKVKNGDGPKFSLGLDAFNLLNRTNYAGFVGNLSSPFFGLPVASQPARRVQLTLGFQF